MSGYENYDLQEYDPYLIPGSTCLANCLGITDTQTLNAAEADISAAALSELILTPISPTFDLAHLKAVHQHVFRDVYQWAGEIRTTEIGKGGQLFLPYRLIETEAEAVFTELRNEHFLMGLDITTFGSRAGYFLGRINTLHPFREGNGRTQRVLLDQLAERAGYAFEWTAISGEQMALACRDARTLDRDAKKLSRLLQLHIVTLGEASQRI